MTNACSFGRGWLSAASCKAFRRAATPGDAPRALRGVLRSASTKGRGAWLFGVGWRVLLRSGRSLVGAFQPSVAAISSFSVAERPRRAMSGADASAGASSSIVVVVGEVHTLSASGHSRVRGRDAAE